MKNREKTIIILSAVLALIGLISLIFAWSTALLLTIGLSVCFGTLLSWLLEKHTGKGTPWWFTLLFAVSFLPVILCLCFSAKAGINGTGGSFIFPEKYGWEAFSETFAIAFLLMTVIPLIPMALIVQIRYISFGIKQRKERNAERS